MPFAVHQSLTFCPLDRYSLILACHIGIAAFRLISQAFKCPSKSTEFLRILWKSRDLFESWTIFAHERDAWKVSDRFFLDMQNDIDVRELVVKLECDIATIKPYAAAAM